MLKLRQEGNRYFIDNKKIFQSVKRFKDDTIDRVFEFAYAMTFEDGEHRDHRSGGSISRTRGQIFINTFQGKLSELGVYVTFFKENREAFYKLSEPDFNVYGLGEWDNSDIEFESVKISVKSTKFYGDLLLLETKDWNKRGEYIPNLNIDKSSIYDFFVLVRIKPDGEKMMKENKILYSNSIDKERLHSLVKSKLWEYDIPGYITNEDLKFLINNNFILPKKSLLNGKILMDAENYYIQSGDMRNFKQLVRNFI